MAVATALSTHLPSPHTPSPPRLHLHLHLHLPLALPSSPSPPLSSSSSSSPLHGSSSTHPRAPLRRTRRPPFFLTATASSPIPAQNLPNASPLIAPIRLLALVIDVSFSKALLLAAVVAEALQTSLSKVAASVQPQPHEVAALATLRESLVCAAAPVCFAAISRSSAVNTPLTVVASGMAKWLELYSGVLMVRVLLSWFPNIPWERQPLQAMRDMCDPYLNLFRNIIPPLFNALDLSPLLAFMVLGILTSILNTTVQG